MRTISLDESGLAELIPAAGADPLEILLAREADRELEAAAEAAGFESVEDYILNRVETLN
jgi:hypothetical protein